MTDKNDESNLLEMLQEDVKDWISQDEFIEKFRRMLRGFDYPKENILCCFEKRGRDHKMIASPRIFLSWYLQKVIERWKSCSGEDPQIDIFIKGKEEK